MKKRRFTPKTPEEIERLARGGAILRQVLNDIAAMVKPGVSGVELDSAAEARLRASGAEPSFKGYGAAKGGADAFPASLCVSVNNAVVHGLPTATPLREGDIVGLDLGCRFEGLYTDTATTVPVGRVSREAQRLLDVTREALRRAVALLRPGVMTGDIGATVQKIAEDAGFSVVRTLVGHGVGYAVHEEPSVPNFGKRGGGVALPAGSVIAIEPMLTAGSHEVEVAPDGWTVVTKDGSLAAHEELTVAITARGARVLTDAS